MKKYVLFTYCTLICLPIFAQKQIHGTITDDKGVAVFASIYTITGFGTICDSLGNFSFKIPTTENTIYIQSLGYNTKKLILVKNETEVHVNLSQNLISIAEIAVTEHQNIESKSVVSAFTTYQKEMERLNPENVNEILQTKAGFTNKSDYQAPLTLRGMSGKRILVLRNGNRRFSSYPAGFMSHTINVYDLECVEVEKGASSVVYGSSAIAGIINLIDKSSFKQNGLNSKFTGGYGSINNEKNLLACGGWSNGKFAVKAGMRYRDADNFKYPSGEIAENSFYSDKDLFITTGYKFSELKSLIFTADIHDGGPWGKPVGFNGSDYMRVQTQEEKSNNYSLKYKQGGLSIFNNIEISTFFSNESRELVKNYYTAAGYMLSYTGITHFSDYYYGALIKGVIKVNDHYKITTGGEIYRFNISTPTDATDYIYDLEYSNRVSNNARATTSGIFIENNWQIQQHIKAIIGIRYNYASVYEGEVYSLELENGRNDKKKAFSGNAATIFTLSKKSEIKVNFSRSFRMPENTELYSDNYTSNGIIYGNPSLKAEFCYSTDLLYSYKKKRFKIEVSPFLWYMNDMISKEEITGMPGTNYTYINIGETRIFGGEISGSLNFNNVFDKTGKITLRVGLAYLNGTDITDSKSFFANGTPLDYVPPLNVKSDIGYTCSLNGKIKLDLAIRSIYYAEQKRLGESNYATPKYFILGGNLRLSMLKIKTKPSLNISINNITNKEYYSYLSYLPSAGRDVRIFLTFNF